MTVSPQQPAATKVRYPVTKPRECRPRPPGLASNAIFGFLAHMDENTGAAKKSPREERLAKALRDNLKRRKAQARAQAHQRAAGSDPEEAASPVASQVSAQKG